VRSRGEIREHDSEAVAAVLLGSLTMFSLFYAIWGRKGSFRRERPFHTRVVRIVARGSGVAPGGWTPLGRSRFRPVQSVRCDSVRPLNRLRLDDSSSAS